jgi:ring-1,2-phenylacetyl-CoA epoxidase subunit PaaC
LPNGDFAFTIARLLLVSAASDFFWRAATGSIHAGLAAVAAKAEKETAYHVRHAAEWLVHLGDGTAQSHRRAQDALDALWPYTDEMFEADAADRGLIEAGILPDPDHLRPHWDAAINETLARATLRRPSQGWMQSGGRFGRHTEHLGHLLAELQFLQRAYPGATW